MSTSALKTENLRKIYANGTVALRGVSLMVEQGDFFALLGPNGAGKTTLIGIVSGLVNKTSGRASIAGHDIDHSLELARSSLGLVPQEFNFNIFEKVEDIVINQAGYYGLSQTEARPNAERVLRQLDLWEKRGEPARALSGGMKRRLMIARALVHEPRVLILDEPTAGVDVELRRSMWEFLQELNRGGVTIILTTHYLEEAEQLCRNIAIINHGEIVEQGSIKELLGRMQHETFVIDVTGTVAVDIEQRLGRFDVHRVDANTIEATVDNTDIMLHDVLNAINKEKGIRIRSMRNKSNRLEEFFIHLTGK